MEEYTFDAFISYSHRDLSWGTWLQKKIETFRIPKDMRGERPKGQGLRVFRDQTDLAGTELQDSLRQNLDTSRYLIVLCSPASAASSWVNEEVKYFVSLGRVSNIIPFIVGGEPLSEDPALECFPPALKSLEDHVLLVRKACGPRETEEDPHCADHSGSDGCDRLDRRGAVMEKCGNFPKEPGTQL